MLTHQYHCLIYFEVCHVLFGSSDEQYESIPDDEIALLARKFFTLHKFPKERKRSPRGCFECGDTTHFIADCPKRKKLDFSIWRNAFACLVVCRW
jgi:hypothetical protein